MFKPMFIPPRESAAVQWIVGRTLPFLAHTVSNIRDVQLGEEDLVRLRELGPHRAILTPNHPTGHDPLVMFWVSRLLGQPFNYLAAREIMDGAKGWLLNRLGAYSVIRGVPDREALRTTRRLLAGLDRKVVIFPEGEIYEHNDTLLAFQSGVPQIGFWALEDLEKAGLDPRLPIVPLAIKYRCIDSPRLAIDNSLTALEKALDLPAPSRMPAYGRLLRVGDRVLSSLERDEGLKAAEGEELSARINRVKTHMLERVGQRIGAAPDLRQSPADQLHLLFHELKQWVGMLGDDFSDYDERLYRRKMEVAAPLFHDLTRLQNFIAITGDYVAAEATAERFLDVLGRLEKEVLGEVRYHVAREALVRVGAPIRLEERYPDYRKDKRRVVTSVTQEMEASIRALLQQLSKDATPIALEA